MMCVREFDLPEVQMNVPHIFQAVFKP